MVIEIRKWLPQDEGLELTVKGHEGTQVKETFTPDILFWTVVTGVYTTVRTHQTEHLGSAYCV